jgi:hypothetical protein
MMNTEPRITDTNSVNDSKGRALGLDGNDFLYVVVGIVAGIGMFLALYSMGAVSLLASAFISACIVAVPTAWVLLFRRNKPEGYAEDFFDDLLNREGWSFVPGNQPSPLLCEDVEKKAGSTATHLLNPDSIRLEKDQPVAVALQSGPVKNAAIGMNRGTEAVFKTSHHSPKPNAAGILSAAKISNTFQK